MISLFASSTLTSMLYGLLACLAAASAAVEKQDGRKQVCRQHGFAAIVYALLSASQLVHG